VPHFPILLIFFALLTRGRRDFLCPLNGGRVSSCILHPVSPPPPSFSCCCALFMIKTTPRFPLSSCLSSLEASFPILPQPSEAPMSFYRFSFSFTIHADPPSGCEAPGFNRRPTQLIVVRELPASLDGPLAHRFFDLHLFLGRSTKLLSSRRPRPHLFYAVLCPNRRSLRAPECVFGGNEEYSTLSPPIPCALLSTCDYGFLNGVPVTFPPKTSLHA